jgi:hypothetical protein
LIQELQVMNVQMRIITEENVDQLLSMSFSDNINKLAKIYSWNNTDDAIKAVNVETFRAIRRDFIDDISSSPSSSGNSQESSQENTSYSTVTPSPEVQQQVWHMPQPYISDSPPPPMQEWQTPQPSDYPPESVMALLLKQTPQPSNSQSSSSVSGYHVPTSSSGYHPQNTPPSDNNVNSVNNIKSNILEVEKPVEETQSGTVGENGENKVEPSTSSNSNSNSNTNTNSTSEIKKISI